MEWFVRLHPRVERQMARWGLSDFMLVEVYLQLREVMTKSPQWNLYPDPDGPGMLFVFEARDPGDPAFQQLFMFRVFYGQDEQHLHVVNGSYWRNYDPLPPG